MITLLIIIVSIVHFYEQHCVRFVETTFIIYSVLQCAQSYNFMRTCSNNFPSIESLIYIVLESLFAQSSIRFDEDGL